MKKILLAVFITAISTSTFAQSENDMKAWQDYMTPGAVHKMLATYDGEWAEEMTMWMAPGAAPQTYTTTSTTEMIMGGRYQVSKSKGDMMGMPFEGMSTLAYDNLKKIFISTWIDNFGTGLLTMTGTWNEKTKTITLTGKMVDPMSGKDQDVKQTIQLIDNDHQLMEMFTVGKDGEFKTMSLKATRKK